MRLTRRVAGVHVGEPAPLQVRGRSVLSAIVKRAVLGPVDVGSCGVAGDRQADLTHHGGRDKAVCAYPVEHYARWSSLLERRLTAGAFGENLAVEGMMERAVCLGDRLRIGTAVLQITQPRQPCFKLAVRFQAAQLALWVQRAGATGFYMRVLERGRLAAGDNIVVLDRPNPGLTVAEANRVLYGDRRDDTAIERLLCAEGLADRLRAKLVDRLEGRRESSRARLYGTLS